MPIGNELPTWFEHLHRGIQIGILITIRECRPGQSADNRINLPHSLLLGTEDDIADIVTAFHKIDRQRAELCGLNQS